MSSHTEHSTHMNIIIIATQPRMLRQMLRRSLDRLPEPRLVFETEDTRRVFSILERVQADWLIVNLTGDGEIPEFGRSAGKEHPSLSIMGLSEDGSHVVVIGAAQQNGSGETSTRYELDDVSLATVLQVLRGDRSETCEVS